MRHHSWIGALGAVLFLSATAGAAEVRRLGLPIEILSRSPAGDELEAQVAVADNGDVLVVWSGATEENFSSEVYGRLFRRDGRPTTPQPFVINSETEFHQWQPRVATLGDGFVVVWITTDGLPCPVCSPPPFVDWKGLSARLIDRDGGFRGPETKIGGSEDGAGNPFLLTDPSGDLVVLWQDGKEPYGQHGRRFDGALHPTTQPFPVQLGAPFGVVGLPGGGFASLSLSFDLKLSIAIFGPTGNPLGEPRSVTSRDSRQTWATIGSFGEDGFAVAWSEDSHTIYLRRFDPTGAPLGQEAFVADEAPFSFPAALAEDEDGNAVVIWQTSAKVFVSFIDPQGQRTRPALELSTAPPYRDRHHLATNGRDWAVTSREFPESFSSGRRIILQRLTAGCAPEGTTLCLGQGRFAMNVLWQTPQGSGLGKVVNLTDETGAFSFFSEDNPELVVKLLDGTQVNGWYWLFTAGLSSVHYELSVLDTETGKTRTYVHPEGPLESRADIRAFSASDGAPPPAPSAAGSRKAHPAETCAGAAQSLCLQGGRFRVQVSFVNPFTGETRPAAAAPFSATAGTFSFFHPDNIEVFVKVLDGTPVNGRIWVFHAALSDLEYTIEVLDVFDGHRSWSYHNPRGNLHSAADTEAF